MSALTNSVGPYLYADGWKAEKVFETGGVPRRFSVLIAGAYNAGGLIGSEYNGIAILDEDNRFVVLDRHAEQQSGYLGPSEKQKAEFQRIMEMDWTSFARFVREHPRYRRCVPDIASPTPSEGRAPISDRVIFGDDKRDPEDPTPMPLRTRREIVEYLQAHHGHSSDGRGYDFCIAWNIKLYNSFDTSGMKHAEEMNLDPAFNEKWEKFVENNEGVFWAACSDALREFTEGAYTTYPGDDQGRYEFSVVGRSGGHLVLTRMDGIDGPGSRGENMVWQDRHAFVEWVENLPDDQLVDLYRLVASVDKSVQGRYQEMEYQFAFQRSTYEEAWRDEIKPAAV